MSTKYVSLEELEYVNSTTDDSDILIKKEEDGFSEETEAIKSALGIESQDDSRWLVFPNRRASIIKGIPKTEGEL